MYTRLFEIDPWKITTHSLEKKERRLQESLTSIGNGYMGMRGNFEEQYSGDHHQGSYFAGVWYPDKTRVGWWKNGYPEYFGKVINGLNYIALEITINGVILDLYTLPHENFYLELDMKNGLLRRSFIVNIDGTRVKFQFERFLSIVEQEVAFIKVTAEVLAGTGTIEITSKLDGNVKNEDSNYEEMFWEAVAAGENFVTTKTIPNNFGIEEFTVTAVMENRTSEPGIKGATDLESSETFSYQLQTGEELSLEKRVAIVTSRDCPAHKQVKRAQEILGSLASDSYAISLAKQTAAWGERWQQADVIIEGDQAAQQGIRFNLFQLFSTYYGEDARLNIGPKGFTGEKYGGATYWDTEAYAVPLYLAIAPQAVTKNLLQYRHNQLPQAVHNAQQQGLPGALYPMVTFTGVECHNEWEITFEEIHRNGAIAYAIYNYTNYTGDTSYIEKEGLEVLIAISRFWAGRVHYSQRQQKFMIHGVTGPNEYENNINNNWYTNKLAAWVLSYTLEALAQYAPNHTAVSADEKAKWQDIVDKMYYPEDQELGVFVQHDTFLDKDLKPVTELAKAELPLNQNWSWDRILRSCFIKQADVLQGIYFFNDQFSQEEKERNFDFYEPMTVHESSLSPCIHAILAAELGKEEKAVEMYERTARLDLDNYNNDTEDGLHITSMTGSWLAIVQGFAGMKTFGGKLSFAPFLPEKWTRYAFHINYQERMLELTVRANEVTIELLKGPAVTLGIYDQDYTLTEKQIKHIPTK